MNKRIYIGIGIATLVLGTAIIGWRISQKPATPDPISYCLQGANAAESICITEYGTRAICKGEVTQCLKGTVSCKGDRFDRLNKTCTVQLPK